MKIFILALIIMTPVLRLSAQIQPYTLTISSSRVLQTNFVDLTFTLNTNYTGNSTGWQIQMANSLPATNWIYIGPKFYTNTVITLPVTNTCEFFRAAQIYLPP
jgi:hypothetical protein